LGATLHHHNNVLRGDSDNILDTVTLNDVVRLAPAGLFPPPPGATQLIVFDIDFTETPNVAEDGDPANCANAPSASVCDDLFLFDPSGLSLDFPYLGFLYTFALDFLPPVDAVIIFDGLTPIGFRTEENKTAVVQTIVTLTYRQIPEPGSVGLLGLGLVLLVAVARKRRMSPS